MLRKKKKKISPMPSCLHRYKFLQCSLFLFFDEPSSSQISSVLTKLFLCLLLSFTHGKQSWFFFFFGSKTLAEHYIVTVQWLLLSSSFLFSFFVKKNFAEALIAEKKILPETIQNIDASSTFDRMLWLKLQRW